MAFILCPECKNMISDTASSCPKCGYQLTQEKIAEIKKNQSDTAGCFVKIFKVILVIFIISLFFFKVGEFFQSPEVKKCISACEQEQSLIKIQKFVSFDPVGICINQCKNKEGYCPAKDGSGGPYTGCFACGIAGGKSYCN